MFIDLLIGLGMKRFWLTRFSKMRLLILVFHYGMIRDICELGCL